MADYVDPNSPYGKSLQQQADAAGISVQALQALQAQYPPTYTQNTQGGQYGKSAGGSYGENPGLTSAMDALNAIKQSGGGQGQQQGPPMSQAGQVSNDPMNAATNWGAAALNSIAPGSSAGLPIYNPMPMAPAAGAKGGVATIGSPVSASTSPAAPNLSVASVFGQPSPTSQGLQYWAQNASGGSAADAASIEKAQGWAPGTIANRFYTAGVQAGAIQPAGSNNPPPAPGGTPTPTRPVNAAGGQTATPWATAPAAPGIQVSGAPALQAQATPDWGSMAGHHIALQKAGQALYANMTGGDPNTATHADINDFHNQLQSTIGAAGAIATPFGNAPAGAANYTAGVTPGISAAGPAAPGTPAAPVQMQAGGRVPGVGNTDTVHALLTPGEYVIPLQSTQPHLGAATQSPSIGHRPGSFNNPIRMAAGGEVPGSPDNDPPEVRRQRLAVAAQQAAAQSGQQPAQSDSSGSSPSGPSLGGYSGPTAAQIKAQNTAVNNQALNSGGASGGGYNIPGGGGYVGASPGTGQSGYIYPNQAAATAAGDVGTGVGSGPGSGMPTQQAAGVVSGLASGLTAAAQAYAASFKDWKVQQDATEKFRGNVAPAAPAANFTQEQA